jgi:hypothetical protein
MRIARVLGCLLFLCWSAGSVTLSQQKPLQPGEVVLLGKLGHAMGIGGETTGWSLELKSEVTLEGQKVNSIEVSGPAETLAKLADQQVKARGFVKHHHGVERKDWLVLEISSIKALPPPRPPSGSESR